MNRIKVNASGTWFEFGKEILNECKSPKLSALCRAESKAEQSIELIVDRSAACFSAVLEYCQTGELHLPLLVCPGAFRRELEFWEVDFDALQECCLYRYQSFLDDEQTRRNFLHKALHPTAVVVPEMATYSGSVVQTCRRKLWKVIDNNENSLLAKLYFIFISLLVILSICVLALGSVPNLRRPVSKCELLEYMETIGHEDYQKVTEILGKPDCSDMGSWFAAGDWQDHLLDIDDFDWAYYKYSWGWGLQPNDKPPFPGHYSDMYPDYTATEQPEEVKINIPKLTVPKPIFYILDIIVNVCFTIDFLLRITACPSLRRYFMSVINILDALALLATFIHISIVSLNRQFYYEKTTWIMLLEFMQVFRALRLFRVVKNVRASKVLGYSLTQDLKDMTLLVTLLFVGISTFAYLFFFAETRETVVSIPDAWYWAVVTMTTVGYGDISPKTHLGRAVASICAICGVLLLSVTLPMFVNNFLTLYQLSCVNESIEKRKATKRDSASENTSATEEKMTNAIYEVIDVDKPPSYETPRKASVQVTEWYHVEDM